MPASTQHASNPFRNAALGGGMGVSPMSFRGILPLISYFHGRDGRDTHGQDARATF
jgi:hypothetical protein